MLYRSTDRRSRRGAPMQNLAHSASFESLDKDAPSKAGTKHLSSGRRSPSIAVSAASQCRRNGRQRLSARRNAESPRIVKASGHDPHRHHSRRLRRHRRNLPVGSVAFEPDTGDKGERHIWLAPEIVNKLRRLRGSGEATPTSSSGSPRRISLAGPTRRSPHATPAASQSACRRTRCSTTAAPPRAPPSFPAARPHSRQPRARKPGTSR